MASIVVPVLVFEYNPPYAGTTRRVSISFPLTYADALNQARTIFKATNTNNNDPITLSTSHLNGCHGKEVELTASSYELIRKHATAAVVMTVTFASEARARYQDWD